MIGYEPRQERGDDIEDERWAAASRRVEERRRRIGEVENAGQEETA